MTAALDKHPLALMVVHWASAALITGMIPMGLIMRNLPLESMERLIATRAHVAIGATLVVLTLIRFAVLAVGPKVKKADMSKLHLLGVKVLHIVMYAALVAILASGVATFFLGGLLPVMSGAEPLPDLAESLPLKPHGALSLLYIALIVVHVGGSVLHQVRHGGVLRRMGLGAMFPR